MEIFNPPGQFRYPSWESKHRGYYDQEQLRFFLVSKFCRMSEKVVENTCFSSFESRISFAKPQKGTKSVQKVRKCVFYHQNRRIWFIYQSQNVDTTLFTTCFTEAHVVKVDQKSLKTHNSGEDTSREIVLERFF